MQILEDEKLRHIESNSQDMDQLEKKMIVLERLRAADKALIDRLE